MSPGMSIRNTYTGIDVMAQSNKFLVTEKHGRVFKQADAYTRVLVAVPGEEISIELAEECGLLDKAEPEAAPDEPTPKAEPVKRDRGKPAPSTVSYPTKTSKAV